MNEGMGWTDKAVRALNARTRAWAEAKQAEAGANCSVCGYPPIGSTECSNPACMANPTLGIDTCEAFIRGDIKREVQEADRKLLRRLRAESFKRPVFVATPDELALITLVGANES